MATKSEKSVTPPIISHTSFTSFLNQLREMGTVPTRIDKTLMPKASGSQSAGTLAALRYMRLIDDTGKPGDEFKAIVIAQDDERKPVMAMILKRSYGFLFDDEDFDLQNASSGQMIEKFRKLDISGSTITKTIAFFLAAAKEYGVPVSPHIKAPAAPKGNGTTRKAARGKEDEKRGVRSDDVVHDEKKISHSHANHHPFVAGLLKTLPEPEAEWSIAGRIKWLQAASNIFGLIYTTKENNDAEIIEITKKAL